MSKVLFVVEGVKTEPRFLKKMLGFYQPIDDSEIYSVGTNIHVLYQEMFVNNDPEDMDLLGVLKSISNTAQNDILSQHFSDIFLVFDVEVQDNRFNIENLRRMLNYFSESTENGKLFLNYPMIESYRHMSSPWAEDYLYSAVTMDQIKRYKELVGSEGCKSLRNLSQYDRDVFDMLVKMNLRKVNMICNEHDSMPDAEQYANCSGPNLFEKQIENFYVGGELFVVNTSLFIIVDYAPTFFLDRS